MIATARCFEIPARFGYSREEIAFLDLVTAHSGYFVPNQFLEFTGRKKGRALREFTERLVTQKHANFHTYHNGAKVFHIFARKLYQAFERDHLRTRRKHALDYLQTRLVALDFVLANQSCLFFEEEAHKVQCLAEQFSVSEADLPFRTYANPSNGKSTLRHFADRFPMSWMRNGDSEERLLTFTFIDPGQPTVQPFITHLCGYKALFSRLNAFAFIYVAPTPRLFGQAEKAFRQIVLGLDGGRRDGEILRYFRIRKAWERNERVPGADVVYLKDSRRRFAGTETESLYRKWASDALTSDQLHEIWRTRFASAQVVFRTAIHGRSLSVFSGNPSERLEPQTESSRERGPGQRSAESSRS